MLPKQRDQLTVTILSKLKKKGMPQVADPIELVPGAEGEEVEENLDEGSPYGNLVTPQSSLRKKLRPRT